MGCDCQWRLVIKWRVNDKRCACSFHKEQAARKKTNVLFVFNGFYYAGDAALSLRHCIF
jgi:hypothetical protein